VGCNFRFRYEIVINTPTHPAPVGRTFGSSGKGPGKASQNEQESNLLRQVRFAKSCQSSGLRARELLVSSHWVGLLLLGVRQFLPMQDGESMTAMSFDPIAIYYIIALIAIPVLGLLYTAITENFYWKGFRDGKRLTQNNHSARSSR
jgi:hypothetical protein